MSSIKPILTSDCKSARSRCMALQNSNDPSGSSCCAPSLDLRLCFFGSGIIMPCLHSSGTSACHKRLKRSVSSCATLSLPCFNNSAVISSSPAALLFFSLRRAFMVSEMSMSIYHAKLTLISKVKHVCGWILVEHLLKCSTQRDDCSLSVRSTSPFLLFIVTLVMFRFPVRSCANLFYDISLVQHYLW